jgi:hypothetical protein
MQKSTFLALRGALLASAALTPVTANAAQTLPTCSQLATLLASNTFVTQTASDNQGIPSPTATIVAATATNAAYCNVQFQFSSESGPKYGYAPGESQTIGFGIGLPLNTTDGGTPSNPNGATWTAINGAWNGKIENIGNGGLAGSIGSTVSATNGGYVGSVSDNGHNTAQNGTVGNFAVIQATHQLDIGKLNDFDDEAIHQQYIWAEWLAEKYYGTPAQRNYWNGCSTGGREGLALAEAFGNDFDGILAGAPATWYEQFWLANAWPSLVNRDDVVGAGDAAITSAQYNNAISHAIASCDVEGTDVVADGVVDDPRQCTYTASGDPTIIAVPNGTCTGANCVDLLQARAIDKIWEGPRNHHGRALWHPWQKVISVGGLLNIGPAVPGGTISAGNAVAWDHKDLTFSPQNLYSTQTLASANPLGQPAPIALEDEFELANDPNDAETVVKADDFPGIIKNVYYGPKHGKIVMWQGAMDNEIYWEDSIEIYREVSTLFGHGNADFQGMQSWFRYYHAPGVGHCGNGVGASPVAVTLQDGQTQIFDDLVKWVEDGIVPQSAGDPTHKGILSTGPGTFGTRPICPWPTTAIYSGTGSTGVASNYTCSGNLDSKVSVLCAAVHTPNDMATSNQLDYAAQGLIPGQCNDIHGVDY